MTYIDELVRRYPQLWECENEAKEVVDIICNMHSEGGKLLICGNGGSAADCEHISGELMKSFLLERKPNTDDYKQYTDIISCLQCGIPAIPLASFTSLGTAFSNDESPQFAFAQLVFILGKKEDVFLGISTSGNSENVVAAAKTAKVKGMKTIAFTGKNGGALKKICDVTVRVPETETYKVQELHMPVYHAVCAEVEKYFYG